MNESNPNSPLFDSVMKIHSMLIVIFDHFEMKRVSPQALFAAICCTQKKRIPLIDHLFSTMIEIHTERESLDEPPVSKGKIKRLLQVIPYSGVLDVWPDLLYYFFMGFSRLNQFMPFRKVLHLI